MTSQTNTSSPFQGNENSGELSAEAFTIHTMKDDLELLQKNNLTGPNPPAKEEIERPVVFDEKKLTVQKPVASNPFLDQTITATEVSSKLEASIKNTPETTPLVEVPMPEKNASTNSSLAYKLVLSIIIILIISILSLSGYYFWITRTPKQTPVVIEPVTEEVVPKPEEEPIVIAEPVEKYSSEKPNYFVLDLETLSIEQIQESILGVAAEIKELPAQIPYEFIITDKNNNPIPFSTFATAAKINFSPTVLQALGKSFSLFIYSDNNSSRLGLSIDITNKSTLIAEMKKQETSLSKDLSFAFLNSLSEIKTGEFQTSSYASREIRYLNLNPEKTFSIDYTTLNENLLIGTSKNTLRAIIDKINQQNTSAVNLKTTEAGSKSTQTQETIIANEDNSSQKQETSADNISNESVITTGEPVNVNIDSTTQGN